MARTYEPRPLDTRAVQLPGAVAELLERLAQHNHDVWARGRLAEGWSYGPLRDDARKEHPCLVPYVELSDSEKAYDREAATESVKAILAAGYELVKV